MCGIVTTYIYIYIEIGTAGISVTYNIGIYLIYLSAVVSKDYCL